MSSSLSAEVESYLRKAVHALKVAQKLHEFGFAADAASKTYYGMFYSAQALLKAHNIHLRRHSAVESAIGHHFVKSGLLDSAYHRMLINARRAREIADYEIRNLTESDSEITPADGEKFLNAVKKVLGIAEKNFA
ncbi:MAG TPA: HEPN domain-containing protein [bacterium]|jgi:uncharacterized protein (UPF0332 family)